MSDDSPSRRRWLVWTVRLIVLVVVGVSVWGTFRGALAHLSQHEWKLRPGWLFASGVLYLLGLLPMAWFWHRVLVALGQPVPWWPTMRAYYLGHLGKYTPGKVMVLVMRVGVLRKWLHSIRLAIVAIMLESLTMMSVGAVLAAVIAVAESRFESRDTAIAVAFAIVAGLPTLPPVARGLTRRILRRVKPPSDLSADETHVDLEESLRKINTPLLASGWIAAIVCWTFLGLSLWATLHSIGVDRLSLAGDLPLMVAAVALAVVGGFVSMLPGGLGVRDFLLLRMLASVCSDADALVAVVLLRLVWLVSELAICGILYIGAKSGGRGARSEE